MAVLSFIPSIVSNLMFKVISGLFMVHIMIGMITSIHGNTGMENQCKSLLKTTDKNGLV